MQMQKLWFSDVFMGYRMWHWTEIGYLKLLFPMSDHADTELSKVGM